MEALIAQKYDFQSSNEVGCFVTLVLSKLKDPMNSPLTSWIVRWSKIYCKVIYPSNVESESKVARQEMVDCTQEFETWVNQNDQTLSPDDQKFANVLLNGMKFLYGCINPTY